MILCIGSVPTDLCDMWYYTYTNKTYLSNGTKKALHKQKKNNKNNNSIVNVYDVVMIMSYSAINKETF